MSAVAQNGLRPTAARLPLYLQHRALVDVSGAIGICDGCSSLELWLSSGMRDSTVRSGSGWRVSWNGGRSKSLLLRWPTRSDVWLGP